MITKITTISMNLSMWAIKVKNKWLQMLYWIIEQSGSMLWIINNWKWNRCPLKISIMWWFNMKRSVGQGRCTLSYCVMMYSVLWGYAHWSCGPGWCQHRPRKTEMALIVLIPLRSESTLVEMFICTTRAFLVVYMQKNIFKVFCLGGGSVSVDLSLKRLSLSL